MRNKNAFDGIRTKYIVRLRAARWLSVHFTEHNWMKHEGQEYVVPHANAVFNHYKLAHMHEAGQPEVRDVEMYWAIGPLLKRMLAFWGRDQMISWKFTVDE